jgi:hypothetical protein
LSSGRLPRTLGYWHSLPSHQEEAMDEQGTRTKDGSARLVRDNMHPMFLALFIETDADDLMADGGRRRARRSRQARSVMVRPAARNRPHRPWP